jgi:hypothetical protein
MERIYAAIDGDTITNTFVGDDTFADLVRPAHSGVVEITQMEPSPGIGWTVHPDGYRPPSPFPSWVWEGAMWQAPTPMPAEGGPWSWDEDTLTWVSLI